MDFSYSEEQETLRALAREILEKEVTKERLGEIEATPDCFDRELWGKLAEANLLGLAVPEENGGMGYGIEALGVLLEELGRAVAPVPAMATLVLAGLPLGAFGTADQRARWLAPMVAGKIILSGALVDADSNDPTSPATRARADGDDWLLEGQKVFVAAAALAERILVPAATGKGVGIFLVDPRARGVALTAARTSLGEPVYEVVLRDVRVTAEDVLGGDPQGAAAWLGWTHTCALAATSAMQVGVSERALEITAGYVTEREQFDRPIGSFQAVQHRLADGFIDVESMRWTAWRALWNIGQGQPAERHAIVAKFWAADAGSRIADSAMHLHGGMGVDVDYIIHRYFLWSKALELHLGSATPQLARLGRDMAREGPQEFA